MIRYRVLDLPVQGLGAFTPTASPNPIASSWGLVRVAGAPGTLPIPVHNPMKVWGVPISRDPKTQGSNNSPDVWLPDKYVPYATNMGPSQHFGMALRRHTPMPVPAVSWISAAKRAMIRPKIGGRAAMNWPRAFQRFPTLGMNTRTSSQSNPAG